MSDPQRPMARRRHELLHDVDQTTTATAILHGIGEDVARHIGSAVADMLSERWAGQQITFPLNGFYTLSDRERAIVQARNKGVSFFDLARAFKMTERGVRKLVARVTAGRGAEDAQADMFGATDPR